jgi:hypothetical protein
MLVSIGDMANTQVNLYPVLWEDETEMQDNQRQQPMEGQEILHQSLLWVLSIRRA